MRERGRKRWWVSGCLIVLAFMLLAGGAIAVLVWRSVRSTDPQSTRLGDLASNAIPQVTAKAGPGALETGSAEPLRVRLELDSCEVYIEPALPGEGLGVEAHYDAGDYRIEEIVDDPGTYRLRFLVDSSRLITGIKQGLRGGQPQLRIRLPVDRPIDFSLLQRNGGAIVDLSGMTLTAAAFDIGGALLKVDADEPLRGTLERFEVKGTQGGVVLESLDLIQPRHVAVDFSMGQAQLDFRGTWRADARVDLAIGMADVVVRLPREAQVRGIGDGTLSAPGEFEIAPPTLTFSVETARRGQLRVFE